MPSTCVCNCQCSPEPRDAIDTILKPWTLAELKATQNRVLQDPCLIAGLLDGDQVVELFRLAIIGAEREVEKP